MSRTIRRLNLCPYTTGDIYREDDARWPKVYLPGMTYRQYLKLARATFHRDNKNIFGTTYSIPSLYGLLCQERPQRRQIRTQIKRAARYDEWDDLSIKRWPKDWTIYY